jgi:hypothetical protein
VDVYDGSWHRIHTGDVSPQGQFVELPIGQVRTITKCRIQFSHNGDEFSEDQDVAVTEVQLNTATSPVKPAYYYQRNKMRRAN